MKTVIILLICLITSTGCFIFEDAKDQCSTEGTSCNGNVLEVCTGSESGISGGTYTLRLSETDCSDYESVCLWDGKTTHGCYFVDAVCPANTKSICIGDVIGDCDHRGNFCPILEQNGTDGRERNCDGLDTVKFPKLSYGYKCDRKKGEYCMETVTIPTLALCTYWPEHCTYEVNKDHVCNNSIKNDAVFVCSDDGIWRHYLCQNSICCETETGAECMKSCTK